MTHTSLFSFSFGLNLRQGHNMQLQIGFNRHWVSSCIHVKQSRASQFQHKSESNISSPNRCTGTSPKSVVSHCCRFLLFVERFPLKGTFPPIGFHGWIKNQVLESFCLVLRAYTQHPPGYAEKPPKTPRHVLWVVFPAGYATIEGSCKSKINSTSNSRVLPSNPPMAFRHGQRDSHSCGHRYLGGAFWPRGSCSGPSSFAAWTFATARSLGLSTGVVGVDGRKTRVDKFI